MKHFFQELKQIDLDQVADILKKKVPKKGKSKSEVARMLGISSQLLGQYMNGRQKPKIDFYNKWKETFKEDLIETNVSNKHKDPLAEILASLNELRGYTVAILTAQEAGQKVVIGSLERLENKPEGTLSEVADKLAIKIQERLMKIQAGK